MKPQKCEASASGRAGNTEGAFLKAAGRYAQRRAAPADPPPGPGPRGTRRGFQRDTRTSSLRPIAGARAAPGGPPSDHACRKPSSGLKGESQDFLWLLCVCVLKHFLSCPPFARGLPTPSFLQKIETSPLDK